MTWEQVAGHWEQFRAKLKEKWGQITDDDLTAIEGSRKQLLDLLEVRYGFDKATATRELDELVANTHLPADDLSEVNNITVATNP